MSRPPSNHRLTVISHSDLPPTIPDVKTLDDLLSEPTDELVQSITGVDGDIIILGVGGKIGPSIARMAKRASDAAGVNRRVIGVARFSDKKTQAYLTDHGIETIRADLFDPQQLGSLPEAPNVIFMVGRKFGTTGSEPFMWAINASLPALVCERFPDSRILAFSTLCVYPFVSPETGGSTEADPAAPVGEYAMSTLARERVFEHHCNVSTTPTSLIRLTYSVEMRYGVLIDIARWVWRGEPIDLSVGYVNVLWQADANAMILRSIEHATVPARIFNVAGSGVLSVKKLAEKFGERMKRQVVFSGDPGPDALLINGDAARDVLGQPRVVTDQLVEWTADWVMNAREYNRKPTRFEVRDGKF